MRKRKIAVIFGGMSTEHDVSIVSGTSVIQNLKKEKYEIIPVYISKEGEWFIYKKPIDQIKVLTVGEQIQEKEKIENVIDLLKEVDVIFPVLHGLYGEDGSIQGLFELLHQKYVGCNILSSSVCMDKVYAKVIFEKAGIPQAKYIYLRKKAKNYYYIKEDFEEVPVSAEEIQKVVEEKLGYPVFIKPSNSGSSVGINKAHNAEELQQFVSYAAQFDSKILIEQNIEGREVECAVLGNEEVKASCVGEILPAEEFYTFDAKYKNAESRVMIPASITEEESNTIRNFAKKAFQAVDGSGLARVDFFIEKSSGKVMINEINTLPGFTQISMYPKLWEACGLSYTDLLDNLIDLAVTKQK